MVRMKFAATFTPGTSELVARQVKQLPLEQLRLLHMEDGFMLGDTTLSPAQLQQVRYWYSVFVVVADVTSAASVEDLVSYVSVKKLQTLLKEYFSDAQTVQVRINNEGSPVPLSATARRQLGKVVQNAGLHIVSHHPDCELWLLRRSNGMGMVAFRLPRARFKRQERAAGELRPELAHILGLIAGVGSKDIVLDAFAGHGAIPRELIAGFSPKKVIALEKDPKLAGKLMALGKDKSSLTVITGDALDAAMLASQSVTRIVTDPPWGMFATTDQPLAQFYTHMLKEFWRVLRPGGIAVVLIGAREEFTEALVQSSFEEVKAYNILVSGKKAAVVKLRKPTTI